jgi:hypothetical protein
LIGHDNSSKFNEAIRKGEKRIGLKGGVQKAYENYKKNKKYTQTKMYINIIFHFLIHSFFTFLFLKIFYNYEQK